MNFALRFFRDALLIFLVLFAIIVGVNYFTESEADTLSENAIFALLLAVGIKLVLSFAARKRA